MSRIGDFNTAIKESNLIIKQQDDLERMLTCTILEFQNKIIITLALDGETDISYDIQIPEQNDFKKPIQLEDEEDDFDSEENYSSTSTIVPIVLIGAGNNMKTQVLASQIGKVMSEESNKNIILNISGQIFGKRGTLTEYHPNDSIVVKQCVHIVTDTYLN